MLIVTELNFNFVQIFREANRKIEYVLSLILVSRRMISNIQFQAVVRSWLSRNISFCLALFWLSQLNSSGLSCCFSEINWTELCHFQRTLLFSHYWCHVRIRDIRDIYICSNLRHVIKVWSHYYNLTLIALSIVKNAWRWNCKSALMFPFPHYERYSFFK